MSRQQFRLLVVLNQILLFAGLPLQSMADPQLPPELAAEFDIEPSIMGGAPLFDDYVYLFSRALHFLTLAAAVGLFYAKPWGRMLYLACFVASLFVAALTPFYLDVGWVISFGTLYGATEGMILGLVYFSHLKRMFERADEGEG